MSAQQINIKRFEMPNAIFLPVRLNFRTTESNPRCAFSRMATMAPKNVIHMNKNRDSSSELMMPSLKPYRRTTLPKTMMTMADNMMTNVNSANRKNKSLIFFIGTQWAKKNPLQMKRVWMAWITWYFQWPATMLRRFSHQMFWQSQPKQFSGKVPCLHFR